MRKFFICIMLFSMLLLLLLSDVGREKEAEAQNVLIKPSDQVITFYSWAVGSERKFAEDIIRQYENEHKGISIRANFVSQTDYLSKISILNAKKELPDVFMLPEFQVRLWGEKGVLLDLGDLEKQGTGGYGVQLNEMTMCLYYNKELLEQEGIIPPTVDRGAWTWEEYVKYAKRLTVDMSGMHADEEGFHPERVKTYGTRMPTSGEAIAALAATAGAPDFSSGYHETLHFSDEKIHVIQSIADLSLIEHCAPNYVMANSRYADAAAMMMSGRLALLIDDSYAFAEYADKRVEVGVAPLPYFNTEANIAWSDYVCLSEQSESQEVAIEFLSYYVDAYREEKRAEGLFDESTVTISKPQDESSDLVKRIMENIWLGASDAKTALQSSK